MFEPRAVKPQGFPCKVDRHPAQVRQSKKSSLSTQGDVALMGAGAGAEADAAAPAGAANVEMNARMLKKAPAQPVNALSAQHGQTSLTWPLRMEPSGKDQE